jgi:hypothetical protein
MLAATLSVTFATFAMALARGLVALTVALATLATTTTTTNMG